jgi:hypothetical protein
MAFQGSLAELPLPDILQLVAVSGKTGRFTIKSERDAGRIFLADGQIVHAKIGQLEGEEAIYELAIWTEGDFVFTPDDESVPKTINKSNTSLLMEAARRIDEWKVLSKRVPSTRLVPVFTEDGGGATITLSPAEWSVIRKADERRSIEDIAHAVGTSAFETAKVVYGLITSGLLALAENLRAIPVDHLQEMGEDERRTLAARLREEVRLIVSSHELPGEVDAALDRETANADAEPGLEQLIDLIRTAEKAVSITRGPNQARALLESLAEWVAPGADGGTPLADKGSVEVVGAAEGDPGAFGESDGSEKGD